MASPPPSSTTLVSPLSSASLSIPPSRTPILLTPLPSASYPVALNTSRITSSKSTPSLSIPPPADNAQQGRPSNDTLVHLYFLFLFLGVFLILGFYYFILRRRKLKRNESRRRGQRALAQDVRNWRGLGGLRRTERHEEGLDERGEAPPPYSAPSAPIPADMLHTRGRLSRSDLHRLGGGASISDSHGGMVPLRILSRNGTLKPPDYEESEVSSRTASISPPPPAARGGA